MSVALLIGDGAKPSVTMRLGEQLRGLGVDDIRVVGADLEAILAALRALPAGPVVLADGAIYTQREALAGVLADPRLDTAILSARAPQGPGSSPVRSERARVVAAGSAHHLVGAPSEWFLGVVKVAAADRPALLEAAERLAFLRLPGEPLALLLVGLVRSGVRVGQSDLRELFWARPADAEALARAERDVEDHDEERVLMNSSVKAVDGFFTTFFVSPYSKHIARWAAHRGLTPNLVTTISLLLGLAAAFAFAAGERWAFVAGAVLLQIAFTTDCVDGQLARFTRTFTPLGAWLDSTFDRLKEWLVYAGLAIGAHRLGDPTWALAGAALTLQTVRHTLDFSFATTEHRVISAASRLPLDDPADVSAPLPAAGAARTLSRWRRLDRTPGVLWAKRAIVLPIGERFAVISLTAALWTPRTTFVVLLAWGGVALVYGLAGRVLRALLRGDAGGAGEDLG